MRLHRFGAAIVAAASLAVAGCGGTEADVTSQAIDVAVCQGEIATLRAETLLAQYRSSKDLAGLVFKLDEAAQKLSLGKLADAAQKLGDYKLKVQTLIVQGKIFPSLDGTVAPADLVAGAQAAIDCILPPPPPEPVPVSSI